MNLESIRFWSYACAFLFFLPKSVLPPPGGFLFEGLSDDEDDFHPVSGLAACHLRGCPRRASPWDLAHPSWEVVLTPSVANLWHTLPF